MSRQKPTPFTEMVQVIDELPVILRNARRARGASLRDAAEQSGASFNALSRLERGKECSVSTLRSVLIWLNETPGRPAIPTEETA